MVHRKLPITPQILLKIRSQVDLDNPSDIRFWAACLVSFYGLFRKANITPVSVNSFDATKHFTVGDVRKCKEGLALTVKHTKTIQCRERSFQIPLPFLHNHPLCPVTAVLHLMSMKSNLDPSAPLFSLHSRDTILTQKALLPGSGRRCYSVVGSNSQIILDTVFIEEEHHGLLSLDYRVKWSSH